MKINHLTIVENKQSLVETHLYESRKILIESMSGLNVQQRRVVSEFYKEMEPLVAEFKLMEATLTPDQITQIFTDVEQGATASGKNRTLLGKGADAAKLPAKVYKAIDNKLDELITKAGEAGPIKNFDAKFEELKKKVSEDNPKIAGKIKALSNWAKENPGKASIVLAVMTAAAGFAGAGTSGGLAVLFFLNSALNLLKGEKFSSAIGKAAKTTGYAALAGMAFKAISNTVVDNIASASNAEYAAMEKAMKAANLDAEKAKIFSDLGFTPDALNGTSRLRWSGNLNNFYFDYDTALTAAQNKTFDALVDAVRSADIGTPEYYKAAGKLHDFAAQAQNSAENLRLAASWDALKAAEARIADLGDGFLSYQNLSDLMSKLNSTDKILTTLRDIGDAGANIVQGAIAGAKTATEKAINAKAPDDAPEQEPKKEESVYFAKNKLSEGQVYMLFNKIEQHELLREAPEPKQDAEAAPEQTQEKKPGFLSRMGKNLTTKVTADKLNKAWKKAGSPTDSNKVAEFLRSQGVEDEVITPVYKQMKLKVPPAPKQPTGGATQDGATPTKGDKAQAGGTTGGKTPPTGKATQAKGYSYNDVKAHIAKLTAKDKRRLLTYISKMQPSKTQAPTKTKPAAQTAGIKQGGYQTTGPKA